MRTANPPFCPLRVTDASHLRCLILLRNGSNQDFMTCNTEGGEPVKQSTGSRANTGRIRGSRSLTPPPLKKKMLCCHVQNDCPLVEMNSVEDSLPHLTTSDHKNMLACTSQEQPPCPGLIPLFHSNRVSIESQMCGSVTPNVTICLNSKQAKQRCFAECSVRHAPGPPAAQSPQLCQFHFKQRNNCGKQS